jgi:hypothetical protein
VRNGPDSGQLSLRAARRGPEHEGSPGLRGDTGIGGVGLIHMRTIVRVGLIHIIVYIEWV